MSVFIYYNLSVDINEFFAQRFVAGYNGCIYGCVDSHPLITLRLRNQTRLHCKPAIQTQAEEIKLIVQDV
jgi:hypothetical protein